MSDTPTPTAEEMIAFDKRLANELAITDHAMNQFCARSGIKSRRDAGRIIKLMITSAKHVHENEYQSNGWAWIVARSKTGFTLITAILKSNKQFREAIAAAMRESAVD